MQFFRKGSICATQFSPSILERFWIVVLLPRRLPSWNIYSSMANVLPQKMQSLYWVSNKYTYICQGTKKEDRLFASLSLPWFYIFHPSIQISVSFQASQSPSRFYFVTKAMPLLSSLQNVTPKAPVLHRITFCVLVLFPPFM